MARFAGKVVIVTGAASGIGEGAARRFAAEGATLVRGDKEIDGLASSIRLHQDAGDVKKGARTPCQPRLGITLEPNAWGARAV